MILISKILQQLLKKRWEIIPRRITKIEIDLTFPKDYDSKTKIILERAAHNCPVHHTLSENCRKTYFF